MAVWTETLHPRQGGKFASKGSGSSKKKRHKPTAAQKATLTKLVQKLKRQKHKPKPKPKHKPKAIAKPKRVPYQRRMSKPGAKSSGGGKAVGPISGGVAFGFSGQKKGSGSRSSGGSTTNEGHSRPAVLQTPKKSSPAKAAPKKKPSAAVKHPKSHKPKAAKRVRAKTSTLRRK